MRARAYSASAAWLVAAMAASAASHAEQTPKPWERKSELLVLATTFFGDGLRFNNPYRLATPLGTSAESVSRTATYVDVGIAAALGDPLGFQHGLALRASFALDGIAQAVVTPSYLLWRRWRWAAAYGRVGVPIVASPDVTSGVEGAFGATWFVTGGVGVGAEIVGDVFYGAGTRDVQTPAYPVLSAQLGVTLAYEILP